MDFLHYLCITLVGIGTIIMAVAIRIGLKVNRSVPREFSRKWLVISLLMVFFLAGYCGFIILQLTQLDTFIFEVIASLVFFGGALFVLLIINLSRLTISQLIQSKNKIDIVNEDLLKKTTDLEKKYSQQIQAEKELREAKAALENIFNSSIPICITKIDYEIIDANAAYYDMFDGPRDKDNRLMCFDSRPGSTCNTENCPVNLIAAGEEEVVGECIKIDDNGKLYYFIVTARPYRNAVGELVGIVESFQDITLRKSAENQLSMEKEQLAITLRSIGDGVITTDLKGNILMLNRVAETLCGWPLEEAINKPLKEVYYLVDFTTRKRIDNPAKRVIATGKPINITPGAVLIARDGWERFVADSAAPILDQKGNIFGVVLVFRDISEKQKLETEIAKLEKLKAVGLLAGGIAHDFNNLLTAILGNISLARLDTDVHSSAGDKLEKAENAIMKAKGLTQQLLTFSRGGEPQKKIIALDELLRESVEFGLRGSNTFFEFNIDKDLWSVDADSDQIAQAVNNLIINANQSMPEGGKITIHAENFPHEDNDDDSLPLPAGRYVKVAFSDQGSGIPKDHLPFVFDPYFTTKKTGSGLGLTTVYSVIKRHGGFIEVDSDPATGSTFTLYLPASTEKPIQRTSPPKEIQRGKGHILVMDDDPDIRDVSGMMLTELGYSASFAKNGREALEAYREALDQSTPYDCVILDLTIPGGMGGKQTISKLLELDPHVRAVVSSGYSNDPVIADFRKYGFKATVNKPYSLLELGKVLQEVLTQEQ